MKLTQNHLRWMGRICVIIAALIFVVTEYMEKKNLGEPSNVWKWVSIGIIIVGLFLLMPWLERKDKK